jgi:phosphoglycolate phosphatase-like HAD superfamily hydrolase
MEMARNAGTAAIGVAWGYHASDELLAHADAVAASPAALLSILVTLSRSQPCESAPS